MNIDHLPEETKQQIGAFLSAQEAFKQWRETFADLQDKASKQDALAETAEAEAEQHKEALRGLARDLVRAEAGDKEALTGLSGRKETAVALAAEHRAFAADLRAQADAMKPQGMLAARRCWDSRNSAIRGYADSEFQTILSGIEEQLVRAINLKLWAYQATEEDKQEDPKGAVIADLFGMLKGKMGLPGGFGSSAAVHSLLSEIPDIEPITRSEISSPIQISRAVQALANNPMQ